MDLLQYLRHGKINPAKTAGLDPHAVLRQALKTAPTGGFSINTLNTSVTELILGRPNMWTLRRYGDSAHLAGLPTATDR